MRCYGREKKKKKSYVFMACCFFFTINGFSFFCLFSQETFSEILTRRSVNKETEDGSVSNMSFQVLSWSPRAFYLPNFATKQQCEAIIDMAKPKLKPSTIALRIGENAETTQNIRTSTGVFIGASEDKSGVLAAIEEKIALATRIPIAHYESFNILRYQLGQKYDSHYDAFSSAEYGNQKSQRLVSFLLYLSTVEDGGETIFPFEVIVVCAHSVYRLFGFCACKMDWFLRKQNGRNMNGSYDYHDCIGLKVKPKQGDAIFFYNMFPNRTIDEVLMFPTIRKTDIKKSLIFLRIFCVVVAEISPWKLSNLIFVRKHGDLACPASL